MKILIMTDLEGVAGVRDFTEWIFHHSRYYDVARELLTREVNAAAEGFFAAGASYILVVDGHGPGAIDITKLDPRLDLMRGWHGKAWPFGMDQGFNFMAHVGQHAKSRTPLSNMAHTQGNHYLELSVNGAAIGEFGQAVYCASELGVRAIFGSGELAFTQEAQSLVPGIETVSVKRGTVEGRGDSCTEEQYEKRNCGAIHLHPQRAREIICAGARRALERAKEDKTFGVIPLKPPFKRVIVLRGKEKNPQRKYAIEEHPTSFIGLMNTPAKYKPVKSMKQLNSLLAEPFEEGM